MKNRTAVPAGAFVQVPFVKDPDEKAAAGIIANGMEILGIAWGGPTMIMGFSQLAGSVQSLAIQKGVVQVIE